MEWFGLTDKGHIRPTNQDIYQIETKEENEAALLVVCDGMGGANAGNVASRFAAESFAEIVRPALEESLPLEKRQDLMLKALNNANQTVFNLASLQPEFHGMGTTLVAVLIWKEEATIINVGDSRAYLFDGKRLHQLTEDHSYVEEMRRQGRISAKDARTHPQKNLITRAVGVELEVEGDLFEVALHPQETLLLCSDGLTGMVEDKEIESTIKKAQPLPLMGDALLALALEGGGRDNITLALFTRRAGEEK